MKSSLKLKLTALATTLVASFGAMAPAAASLFDQTEVRQDDFIAIASPVGQTGNHQLLIVEQVSDSRDCWSESGSSPTLVEPLLLNFNFSGICGRSTDSNGYSIRAGGEDLGLQYRLKIVKEDGDMLLMGVPDRRSNPSLEIGRAYGQSSGFTKIVLNSGWRFAKRSYQGRTLGHVYLTNDLTLAQIAGIDPIDPDPVDPVDPDPTFTFPDIRGDIYASDIEEAVRTGFIAGFSEDNTFRPRTALTREQLVSMVLEGLKTVPGASLNIPTSTSARPYSDVNASRWSAAKIQWARDNNIVSGYPDGTFRPAQTVTRAEMMAVLRRASEYGKSIQGLTPELDQKQVPQNFADTTGHWADALVGQMSGYCGVASSLNETGNRFAPDTPALRNYAAAATLRALNCVKAE